MPRPRSFDQGGSDEFQRCARRVRDRIFGERGGGSGGGPRGLTRRSPGGCGRRCPPGSPCSPCWPRGKARCACSASASSCCRRPARSGRRRPRCGPRCSDHTLATLGTVAGGFMASVLVSLPLAMLIAASPAASAAIYPLLVVTQSIPKVALAPILIVALGANEVPRIIVTFLVAFFPLVVGYRRRPARHAAGAGRAGPRLPRRAGAGAAAHPPALRRALRVRRAEGGGGAVRGRRGGGGVRRRRRRARLPDPDLHGVLPHAARLRRGDGARAARHPAVPGGGAWPSASSSPGRAAPARLRPPPERSDAHGPARTRLHADPRRPARRPREAPGGAGRRAGRGRHHPRGRPRPARPGGRARGRGGGAPDPPRPDQRPHARPWRPRARPGRQVDAGAAARRRALDRRRPVAGRTRSSPRGSARPRWC